MNLYYNRQIHIDKSISKTFTNTPIIVELLILQANTYIVYKSIDKTFTNTSITIEPLL